MPITRWKSVPRKQTVVVEHGPEPLLDAIRALWEEGCVNIDAKQVRFTNRWSIEATKFIRVEEK